MNEDADQVAARLKEHLRARHDISEHIHRHLLIALHTRGIVTIDQIHDMARQAAENPPPDAIDDPNQPERHRWDDDERIRVESLTREYACQHFTVADIDDLVNLTLKRERIHTLEDAANNADISYSELVEQVQQFCMIPLGETRLAPAEVMGIRVALIRHLISDHLEFLGVAKKHLTIRDFDAITRRIVGPSTGMGRIGGKAGGMILAHRVLATAQEKTEPFLPVAMPESFFLRSDVVEDFLRLNRLAEYQNQKYKPIDQVTREYPLIRGVFRNGDFPMVIVQKLRHVLDNLGTHPLIVRSSSLLEDRIGTAFCGKYASVFIPNQGTLEQRLRALLGGIAEVYASILAPDPILYRREHNLIDYVEEMGVLIQKVVGRRVGDYFLPAFAGVAFSRNEYRWSPRIKSEDGLLRVVMGLGTRAVDRSGSDYPRMVALGEPTLRPESTTYEIVQRAQQTVDVINMKTNRMEAVPFRKVLEQTDSFAALDLIVSIHRDEELFAPPTALVDGDPSTYCITFDKLMRSTPFPAQLRAMLARLEEAYGRPVDIEFACDGEKFYILQCRTLFQAADSAPVTLPEDICDQDVIFDANRYARTGLIEDVQYIVYVDPLVYDAVPTRARRFEIARAVGRINRALPRRAFILIGPGRWGSNDIRLGVPVHYADINHSALLIEVARKRGGFVPEVSFGTHFFQDLVEAGIHYLPLYPDSPDTRFNEEFLLGTPNALSQILPQDADFASEIRVIHLPAVADGRHLTVAMDGRTERAVAYLTKP